MPDYSLLHEQPECFYEEFERKSEWQRQTHYCPGCGHGIVHKLLAEAIDELGIRDRVILISPVGCSVFAYYYFDVGNVQAAHGRAPAVATAVKRAHPEAIVVSYQGDGDLAAIGAAEILHCANRGENITTLFVNNAIYGMTGGQMAPTTMIGQKSTTTPGGRDVHHDGYPMKVCELLSTLEGPAYLERVSLGGIKQIMKARKAIRKALEVQMNGVGFSLVELLSPCPTVWKLEPVNARDYVADEMEKVFPLGVTCDRTGARVRCPLPPDPPPLEAIPGILGLELDETAGGKPSEGPRIDWRIRVAGFGGQGVQLLGQWLAEAGMDAGLHVSWLPSYGPEMRSGTSNCHVRLSSEEIDSPVVTKPNVLLALNEPSLEKFLDTVEPGGVVIYNGVGASGKAPRSDVRFLERPFTAIADAAGSARTLNAVMLGALREVSRALPEEAIESAMRRLVKREQWRELNRKALAAGRTQVREEELTHA
ncbi:MAG: 2-ketoisovalerate ferredoxin oxidoreductase [Acidimicrobiia bacterium]|nr:2-ketoisovalerate ferredoxin oxidoreductase [Acidimicrobiia bacterium]